MNARQRYLKVAPRLWCLGSRDRGRYERMDATRVVQVGAIASCFLTLVLTASQIAFSQETTRDGTRSGLRKVEPGEILLKEVPKVTAERPMNFWMKHKLGFSKKILESLTLGDYVDLAHNARQMRILSKIEGFVRRSNPEYRAQLKAFDRALAELIENAEQENIKHANASFSKMTTSCVTCHAYMRVSSN